MKYLKPLNVGVAVCAAALYIVGLPYQDSSDDMQGKATASVQRLLKDQDRVSATAALPTSFSVTQEGITVLEKMPSPPTITAQMEPSAADMAAFEHMRDLGRADIGKTDPFH